MFQVAGIGKIRVEKLRCLPLFTSNCHVYHCNCLLFDSCTLCPEKKTKMFSVISAIKRGGGLF